jgi:hypothetical protein
MKAMRAAQFGRLELLRYEDAPEPQRQEKSARKGTFPYTVEL